MVSRIGEKRMFDVNSVPKIFSRMRSWIYWQMAEPWAAFYGMKYGTNWRGPYSKALYEWKSWQPPQYRTAKEYKKKCKKE